MWVGQSAVSLSDLVLAFASDRKNKHMMKHHEETGHPLMRSMRMNEGWMWCYVDNAFFEKDVLGRYSV